MRKDFNAEKDTNKHATKEHEINEVRENDKIEEIIEEVE